MGNNKKAKIMTRVIAGVLVLVMALGFIIPYVSASEIEDTQSTETTEVVEEEEVVVSTQPPVEDDRAPSALPDGLYYEKVNDKWVIKVRNDANVIPVQVMNVPPEYAAEELILFVANLETQEVQTISLMKHYGFVGTMNIKPGYYAFYANEIGWGDGYDNYFAFNDGEYQFFRLGSTTQAEKDGIPFADASNGLYPKLTEAGDNYSKVMAGQTILVTAQMKEFPSDLHIIKPDSDNPVTNPGEGGNGETGEGGDEPVEEERDHGSVILNLFIDMFKQSIGILIVLAACAIGVVIVKKKREREAWEQTQNDKYDDRRIR